MTIEKPFIHHPAFFTFVKRNSSALSTHTPCISDCVSSSSPHTRANWLFRFAKVEE